MPQVYRGITGGGRGDNLGVMGRCNVGYEPYMMVKPSAMSGAAMELFDRCLSKELGLGLMLMTAADWAVAALITVSRRRVPLSVSGARDSVPADDTDARSLKNKLGLPAALPAPLPAPKAEEVNPPTIPVISADDNRRERRPKDWACFTFLACSCHDTCERFSGVGTPVVQPE